MALRILKLNKMKNYFIKSFPKPIIFIISFILFISLKVEYLNAEYLFEELEIDTSTKTDDSGTAIPTNHLKLWK